MRRAMPPALPSTIDVLIVGAGIAGASLAAALAPHRQVMLIEGEDAPGYHATGRSAAFWHETYGGPYIQPLSTASFSFLDAPPSEFSDHGFLSPRAAVTIGRRDEAAAVDDYATAFAAQGVEITRLPRTAIAEKVPGIRADWCEATFEPACCDIDVGGLHAAYLRTARRAGARLATRARLIGAHHVDGGWDVDVGGETLRASLIVNAAGAWADQVAAACGAAPVGIQPYRRTVVQVRLGVPTPAELPLVIHVGGQFYFKGAGAGRVWLTPHDETPSLACDISPDDDDVALAIERMQAVVDWPIAAVEHKWAGLRSFASDRLPVLGADPQQPGFIWCAGQGGFGIQTAPAIAALLAAQLGAPPPVGAVAEIAPAIFSPSRFS